MSDHVKRVLLVHDDPVEAGILGFYLRRSGLETLTVSSNEEAIENIDPTGHTALLSLLEAGGIDGFELARRCVGIPTVFMLLVDEPLPAMLEFEALRLGIGAVFTKATDPKTVAAFIRRQRALPLGSGSVGLPEESFGGDLQDRHVSDLIRFCDRHELSALLEVTSGEDFGGLLIKDGRVIDAWMPGLRGRSALNAALMLQEGQFALYLLPADAEELVRPDVIQASTEELVANGQTIADAEVSATVAESSDPDDIPFLAPSEVAPTTPSGHPNDTVPDQPQAPATPTAGPKRRRRHRRESNPDMLAATPLVEDFKPDMLAGLSSSRFDESQIPPVPSATATRPAPTRVPSKDIPPLPLEALAHSEESTVRPPRRPVNATDLAALPARLEGPLDEEPGVWSEPFYKRLLRSAWLGLVLTVSLALVTFWFVSRTPEPTVDPAAETLSEAQKLMIEGRFTAARKALANLDQATQEKLDVKLLMAVAEFRRAKYPQAAEHFQKILASEKTLTRAHWYLGTILHQEGKVAEAQAAWSTFVKNHPKHAKADAIRKLLKGAITP